MPDLVGPVGLQLSLEILGLIVSLLRKLNQFSRVRHGSTIALRLDCGCERKGDSRSPQGQGPKANYVLDGRYSTMDNIDGKQARRTGQSSGLGELFEYDLEIQIYKQIKC